MKIPLIIISWMVKYYVRLREVIGLSEVVVGSALNKEIDV